MNSYSFHRTPSEDIEGNNITHWEFKRGGTTPVIDVSDLVDEEVLDCKVVDTNARFLAATYREEYDSPDRWQAIISVEDNLQLRRDILSWEFVERHDLFIITLERMDRELDREFKNNFRINHYEPSECCGVIDRNGNYVIPPHYHSIAFRKDDNLFHAYELINNTVGNNIFTASGKKVGRFEV